MNTSEKARVLAALSVSPQSKSQALAEIGIPRRTYYNWVRRQKEDDSGEKRMPWNRLKSEESKLGFGVHGISYSKERGIGQES